MSRVYDNWERLVGATLRREQLRLYAQRTPSDLSLVSSSSSSFNFSFSYTPLSSRKLSGKTFEYDEILRATNYFSQTNFIKCGRSGDLFRGVLDNGIRVVIKKIDLSSAEKEFYCISELELLGKLSDCSRSVLPPRGHCLENRDEKYLVYTYMPNEDLSSSFYPEIVVFESLYPSENWRRRLRIAIGLAEALSYLHQCNPPIVHRDVQASSILLDDSLKVRLCSLGDVCTQERERDQPRITGFLGLPQRSNQGPTGTSEATCAYDVYCFGKVLLELVTGKLGVAADSFIVDNLMNKNPDITPYHNYLTESMIDPFLDMHDLKEIQAAAMIAVACLNPEPPKRPPMIHVLEALQYPSKAHVLKALQYPSKAVTAEDMVSGVKAVTAEDMVSGVTGLRRNMSGQHRWASLLHFAQKMRLYRL